jgi:hypothetical protein
VPLPGNAGFAPGLITRAEPRRDGIVLCCFFAPVSATEPTLDQVHALRAADAVLIRKLDRLGKEWPRLGRSPLWDRGTWPVPAFRGSATKKDPAVKLIYDDDLGFVAEQVSDRAELETPPGNESLSATSAASLLANLLDTIAVTKKRPSLLGKGIAAGISAVVGLSCAAAGLAINANQGGQHWVSASVRSKQCFQQIVGPRQTLCDAAIQVTLAGGQVISATVQDASPSEFSGPRDAQVIHLKYDENTPFEPFTQGDYVPAGVLIGLVVGGGILVLPILLVAVLLIRRRARTA